MIFAHYDLNLNVVGVYDEKIHDKIPKPNVKITEKRHIEYLTKINSTFDIKVKSDLSDIEFIPFEPEIIRNRKLEGIRYQRDKKLLSSDWTQLQDIPLSEGKREEWRQYRKELREMMATVDPDNPQFPIEPKPE